MVQGLGLPLAEVRSLVVVDCEIDFEAKRKEGEVE
jgi:hypothetical protein